MNENDEDGALLAAARRGLSPTQADAARVLSATRAALLAPAAAFEASSPAPAATGSAATQVTAWLKPLIAAVSICGASGGVGYYFGYQAGRSDSAAPIAAHLDAPAPPIVPRPRTSPRPSAAAPPVPAVARHEPAEPALGPRPARSSRVAPAENARATELSPAAQSLEAETRALRRVERALRDGDPRLALELLGELDRTVPEGKLQEERLAAFSMARCALGAGSAATIVREFSQRHPQSVYFARVAQACRSALPAPPSGQRIGAAADTHGEQTRGGTR